MNGSTVVEGGELVQDFKDDIVMLGSKESLQLLQQNNFQVFGDGTFKYAPKGYFQMYTLLILNNNIYTPVVYFLLKNKMQGTYRTMFRLLRSHCLDLRIAKLQMDFEVAAHNVAKEVFPEAEVRGCRFHPAQAWFRKLGRLVLHSVYNHKTSKTAIWLKSIFGLPGLEPEEVEQFFNQELKSQAPERPAVAAFIFYLSQTYITDGANHVGRDYGWGQAHNQWMRKFPPALWSWLCEPPSKHV